jgi:eukaryotic translation initiation factor 2C
MGLSRGILKARDYHQVSAWCQRIDDGYGGKTESDKFMILHNRLRKLTVRPHYKGCPVEGRDFIIKGLVNADCEQFQISYCKDRAAPASNEPEMISLETYFRRRYNVILEYPNLPVVEMTRKDIYYPMEFLVIQGLQRYPFKLDEYQTSNMIKFAVSRPADRLRSVRESKAQLNHDKDPVLNAFGLRVEPEMARTKARILPNPEVQFGNNQRHNPGTSGRWDLRGKKFLRPNRVPLEAWSIGFFPGKRNAINKTQVEAFADNFTKIYSGHGAVIRTKPLIVELKEDIGEAIKRLYDSTKTRFKREPQFFLVVVPDRNSFSYLRIKKSCDCRFGVASQVLQSAHVAKNMAQYISNVCMKVNAKLGGTTARAVPKINGTALRPGSIIIGADVSHASPGSVAPSMAAVSVSIDEFGSRYMGTCETNQERVEIISTKNILSMLRPLIHEWMTTVGGGRAPENIYYFRDGVSTGQFRHVLEDEVPSIKEVMAMLTDHRWKGKFTVIIANKRHHIRAFPNPKDTKAADRFGNPLPGILIERDVTSPHDWDFILYSHIALQGTARPVHYHVILDQIGHRPEQLQNMIYDHCYQYMRSTTSVSLCTFALRTLSSFHACANSALVPAVYYAHLISNRARTHEDVPASSGPRSGPEIKLTDPKPKHRPIVTPRLLPIRSDPKSGNRLPWEMWYI